MLKLANELERIDALGEAPTLRLCDHCEITQRFIGKSCDECCSGCRLTRKLKLQHVPIASEDNINVKANLDIIMKVKEWTTPYREKKEEEREEEKGLKEFWKKQGVFARCLPCI